jgi:hypothetical protein
VDTAEPTAPVETGSNAEETAGGRIMALKLLKVLIDGKETEVIAARDGKPIDVDNSGNETAIDVPHMFSKITALNAEAKTNREAAEAATNQLAKFANIDPAAAAKALETVANLDTKKLIDAGEVDKVKAQVAAVYEDKIVKLTKDSEEKIAAKDSHIYKLEVSNRFASSPFINGDSAKIILPPDIAEATFGKNFKIEEGRMVAYIGDEKIYSKERAGELADFEEAIQVIVDRYPLKDRILRGTNSQGNGADQKNQQHQRKQDTTNLTSTQKIAEGLKQLGA